MFSFSRRTAIAAITSALLSFSYSASATDTPLKLDGTTVVSAEQAKKLAEGGATVIDSRVAAEYAEAHVKGAKNIPYKEKSAKAADFDASQDSFDVSKLPADKNAPLVIYCNSGECWKSYKASAAALKAGHKKVYWFRGGFPEWKAKGYAIE